MLRLPLLEPHRDTLEKCVYCPKLSRAACPISNVEANESVTPWGKMSMAFFAARGDVPIDPVHADSAWACSACFACRERCDHKNDVAATLHAARAEYFAAGVAPNAAKAVAARFARRAEESAQRIEALEGATRVADRNARVVVLGGCGYARHAPDVFTDGLTATAAFAGAPVRALRSCCGLPQLHAGDRNGFIASAEQVVREIAEADRIIAVDPGCARALLVEYPRVGVTLRTPELFIDLAYASIDRLRTDKRAPDCRYHDPCQLGRGLGRYDEPRAVLARIVGKTPAEFQRRREYGECSGGGGMLPATRPTTSRAMADARIEEHRQRGGVLVTHCASSLHRFRTRGERAEDLVSLVARALGPG
jgi:Fe-S oxidoreductase